jgi:diguanylate cyclase (GGDEF)-like protein
MAQLSGTIQTQLPSNPGLVTSVGLVADRLARSIRRGGSGAEVDQRALLERLLAVAAEAEQRITEQTQRIAVLEALSITDELTGLVNRRGFSRELRRALAEAKRYRTGGVLMYMDIDEFKKINDLYGHQAGDEVLHRIAELLASHVRATDIVSRLGGDEFAVLIANSPTEDGLTRARELERLVNTSTVAYGGVGIPIHASFGVVTYDDEDEHESLMVRADRAMYSNKHRDERVLRPRFPHRSRDLRRVNEGSGGA